MQVIINCGCSREDKYEELKIYMCVSSADNIFFCVEGLKKPGLLKAFNTCMGSELKDVDVKNLEAAWKRVCVTRKVEKWADVAVVGAHQLFAGLMADSIWTSVEKDVPSPPEDCPDMMGTTALVDMEYEDRQETSLKFNASDVVIDKDEVIPAANTLASISHTPPCGPPPSSVTRAAAAKAGSDVESSSEDSDDESDSDVSESAYKHYGPRDGVVKSFDSDTDKIIFRMNNGDIIHLTPHNVADSALKAFEGKRKLAKVGEKWTQALSGGMDGVEFLKEISHAEKDHILITQIEKEKSKRVEVDKAYTSIFFARIDGPKSIAPVMGTEMSLTHTFLSRGMERFLKPLSDSFFAPGGCPRMANDYAQVGVGTLPGGTEGFGVFSRKDFVMPLSTSVDEHTDMQDDFVSQMPFVGYPLCLKKLKANGLTIDSVLSVSSKLENGGLRSALQDVRYQNVVFISHGGSLATLVNAGGQYSKLEIVLHDDVDAISKEKSVKLIEVNFDEVLTKFFKDNPTIANCLDTSMLINRGKGKIKRKKSAFVDGVPYIGAKIPCFYMCPIGGETFCAGEELFCNYTVGNENYVSLDEQDSRFLGNGNSKYVRPLASKGKQLEDERKIASEETAQFNLEGVPEQTINDANDLAEEFISPETTSAASGLTPVALLKTKVVNKKRSNESSTGNKKPKKKKKKSGKKTASAEELLSSM